MPRACTANSDRKNIYIYILKQHTRTENHLSCGRMPAPCRDGTRAILLPMRGCVKWIAKRETGEGNYCARARCALSIRIATHHASLCVCCHHHHQPPPPPIRPVTTLWGWKLVHPAHWVWGQILIWAWRMGWRSNSDADAIGGFCMNLRLARTRCERLAGGGDVKRWRWHNMFWCRSDLSRNKLRGLWEDSLCASSCVRWKRDGFKSVIIRVYMQLTVWFLFPLAMPADPRYMPLSFLFCHISIIFRINYPI